MAHQPKADRPRAGKKATKRLVVLDTHAIIHRAYHALPDFSSSKGEPTGALYGLISMLLRIAEELKPDYLVAARDLPGKTQRHEEFEAYKATRAKAEPELIVQLERAPEAFKAFGIPLYAARGYEADDVIGAIVSSVRGRSDVETVIATGDLDTLQLVRSQQGREGGVRVFTLHKGMSDTVLYDEARVRERYGFGPAQVVDYKALRGDPSDNIPGIRGIGEKTATELVKEFGSLDGVYDALEKHPAAFAKKVKPRIVELLKAGKADAALSKQLAEIRSGAPVSFALPDHPWRLAEHADTAAKLCDELEFRSLKARVRERAHEEAPAAEKAQGAAEGARTGTLFTATNPPEVPAEELRETALAVWLLHSDTTDPSLEDILRYAGTEEFAAAKKKIFAELRAIGRLQEVYEKIEKPLIAVVERMNATGVYIDTAHLKELAREYHKELEKVAARIYRTAGHEFNISSPRQLAAVLYDELKIVPERQKLTAGGARTTRESELAKLVGQNPIVADVLSYRELQKLLGTYIEKMPDLVGADGRLRAEFVQAGTTTGRMSSKNPNLQNIPIKTEYGRRIREAFAAERGARLVALDYSQIELRIAAGLSGDKALIEVFKKGEDVHTAVAARVFGVPAGKVDYEMRRRAKVINFGIIYGMGVNALKQNLGGEVSRADAAAFLDAYFAHYAGLAAFIERVKKDAAKTGYTETLFGRRRYFPALRSTLPGMRAQAERMAINAPMQGTQSDIIKLAMTEADKLIEREGWREHVRLVMQVHDELVYEIRHDLAEEAARKIKRVMETVVPASKLHGVPMIAHAEAGRNWGRMEGIPSVT